MTDKDAQPAPDAAPPPSQTRGLSILPFACGSLGGLVLAAAAAVMGSKELEDMWPVSWAHEITPSALDTGADIVVWVAAVVAVIGLMLGTLTSASALATRDTNPQVDRAVRRVSAARQYTDALKGARFPQFVMLSLGFAFGQGAFTQFTILFDRWPF